MGEGFGISMVELIEFLGWRRFVYGWEFIVGLFSDFRDIGEGFCSSFKWRRLGYLRDYLGIFFGSFVVWDGVGSGFGRYISNMAVMFEYLDFSSFF